MKHFFILLLLASIVIPVFAQGVIVDSALSYAPTGATQKTKQRKYPKNVIKMNLSSLLLSNYNFVYERSLSRKISFSLGYRTMPSTVLGNTLLVTQAIKYMNNDQGGLQGDLNKVTLSGQAYTAEFRFYAGRKVGPKGFYLGLYGRYSSFKYNYQYEYNAKNNNYLIPINGTATGNCYS